MQQVLARCATCSDVMEMYHATCYIVMYSSAVYLIAMLCIVLCCAAPCCFLMYNVYNNRSRQDVAEAVERVRHSIVVGTTSAHEVDAALLQDNLQTKVCLILASFDTPLWPFHVRHVT